ncbi:unnamed protein product [Rotaria magnacalcarata]
MASSCEFQFMEYVAEQSIDPNLVCSICHKAFKDPVCTPCDHTFGRACITHWLDVSANHSCPVCVESPLALDKLTVASRLLRNMLDPLRVTCTLCGQTELQRGNFEHHLNKVCPKMVIKCIASDIKCPWQGIRDELQDHVRTCVFELLRPVLSSIIAENRKLNDQVRQHEDEINKLKQALNPLQIAPRSDYGDDSDDASSIISETSTTDNGAKEEDTIYIRNLPATVKFNDLFDLFSKFGRIKFNPNNKKTDIFILKNKQKKDGPCGAKVAFVDKESADAAVLAYDGKHIQQWNTRIQVSISYRKRRNPACSRGAHSQDNALGSREAKPTWIQQHHNLEKLKEQNKNRRRQPPQVLCCPQVETLNKTVSLQNKNIT